MGKKKINISLKYEINYDSLDADSKAKLDDMSKIVNRNTKINNFICDLFDLTEDEILQISSKSTSEDVEDV